MPVQGAPAVSFQCTSDGRDPVFVFEQTSSGGWSPVSEGQTSGVISGAYGYTVTFVGCSAALPWLSDPSVDTLPVGPGQIGCDPEPTTVQLPVACAGGASCSPGVTCGKLPDGCGGTLDCGSCGADEICVSNRCVACAPPPRGCPRGTVFDPGTCACECNSIRCQGGLE